MASTIKIKRSSTPSSVPTGLEAGELALNLPDKRIYSSDGTTVFRIGDKELANTNARINLVNNNLTGTNTALRTLISDRLQVANAVATYQTKAVERAALANTNAYIATKVNTSTFNSALANTNSFISTKATWSALTSTNTALRTLISDRLQVANAVATYQTKAVERAALANTNAAIATQTSRITLVNTNLTGTNTALRTLISDRYQVSNVNTNFFNKTGVVTQTVTPAVSFSANVAIQGKLTVYGGIQTYSANNLVVSDNMIYLNSGSTVSNPDLGFAGNYNDGTYHHTGFFRDASDNGTWKVYENYGPEPDANVFINTSHATFRLAPFSARNIFVANNITVSGNTTVAGLRANNSLGSSGYVLKTNGSTVFWSPGNFNQYLQVTNANATFTTKAYAAANSYVKSVLANTNSYIATKVDTTTFNSALANTNSYIATQATRINLVNSNLTGTNTALRTLISDRLQVANAVATYATKSNPTTSDLLAHTGRATISTNLAVSGNTSVVGLKANNSLGTAGYVLKTNGTAAYWDAIQPQTQYLQVSNAVATYAVKSNPSTSGFFNHTGRLTVGTNLAVSGNTRITGSTIIDGDLTVEGAVTYISSSTLNVDDSMIKLAANNAADTVDVGFYGKYTSSGNKYAGIFRDASDGIFKAYSSLQNEPTSTVDTGGTGYTLAQFDAIIDGGTY
jgi:chorismate mutase